jgi:hypothetical protein
MWGRRGLELCRAVVQHARAEARVLTLMYEIPSGSSSFYRGFGSMISCACRTLSPSHLIQMGFNFVRILLRSSVGENFLQSFGFNA